MRPFKFILISILFVIGFIPTYILSGEGYIVAVGGGTESDVNPDTWSGVVYRRIVELGDHCKVGVLSFNPETEWIPGYFKSLGASEAVNIRVYTRERQESAVMVLDFYKNGWIDFSDWKTAEDNPGPRQSVAITGLYLHYLTPGWKYDINQSGIIKID
ncbi:MAG: hypothetical protein JW827_10045 [Spirochaetes bacterium]|nr:hypothetical protein [Spirochaetota bacterium]